MRKNTFVQFVYLLWSTAVAQDISEEDLLFLPLSHNSREGQQIIFTGQYFNHSGYVSSWSGVGVADSHLPLLRRIHMQVWRPAGNMTYNLVGVDTLEFTTTEIRATTFNSTSIDNNYEYFNFTMKRGSFRAYFESGDVIGCFVPPLNHSGLIAPVSLVYYNSSLGGRMIVKETTIRDSCSVCDRVGSLDNVVPLITAVTVVSADLQSEVVNCTQTTGCISGLSTPTTGSDLTTPTTSPPGPPCVDCESSKQWNGIIPILASTVILIIASLSLLLCTLTILYYMCMWKPKPEPIKREPVISRPILTSTTRESSAYYDEPRSASVIATIVNIRSDSMETGLQVQDDRESTRISNLLEFHPYPYSRHSSTLNVANI